MTIDTARQGQKEEEVFGLLVVVQGDQHWAISAVLQTMVGETLLARKVGARMNELLGRHKLPEERAFAVIGASTFDVLAALRVEWSNGLALLGDPDAPWCDDPACAPPAAWDGSNLRITESRLWRRPGSGALTGAVIIGVRA